MSVQPQLEELEDRSVPSAADLASFEQQQLPALKAEFHAIVPIVQSNLQNQLNQIEALAPSLPTAYQPLLNAFFAQEEHLIKSFPALADAWFHQTVASLEAHLLAQQDSTTTFVPPFLYGPGFLYPFGFLGYPGAVGVPIAGGVPVAGGTSSSGLSAGSSMGSSFSPQGRVMGAGLYSTNGAMTLPPINHP